MTIFSYRQSKDNLLNICKFLLKSKKIRFTELGLSKILEDDIEYPSLLCLKKALSQYGIQSGAVRKNKYSYEEFETPFVCSIQKKDWDEPFFTVVTGVENDIVSYLDPIHHKFQNISLNDFEKIDKNIILMLDTSGAKDEYQFLKNKAEQKIKHFLDGIPFYLAFMIIVSSICYIFSQPFQIQYVYGIGFIFTSFLGLIITALLIWHEIDQHNPLTKEMCNNKSKMLNCSAVLSSAKASLFGINWSIWGGAFFSTLFLSKTLFPINDSIMQVWVYISLFASHYIFFSLYYQWKIVKQWCPLCLIVQALLMFNAIISYIYIVNLPIIFSYYSLIITLLLFISFLFLISITISMSKKANNARVYEKKWKSLKYDQDIFQILLEKSEHIHVPVDGLGIIIGNVNASNEIIKVCNPYCGPCARIHPELEEIIKNNIDIRIRIIFTASGDDDDLKTFPVAHLLAIQEVLGNEEVHRALDNWYLSPEKNYEVFAKQYPIGIELKQQKEKMRAMRNWCDLMKIRATPTIYINGRELPENYNTNEIINFF